MPAGRPTGLTQTVRHRPDGTPVTAGEAIIEHVTLGLDYTSACAATGITRTALHQWRLRGARARARIAQGRDSDPADQPFIEFADALERADAEAEASRLAIIQRAAQGGARVVKTVEKLDAQGTVIERTVTTETLRPEWTAAAWFLERRYPNRYARRVELTGAEGTPLVPEADRARGLADSLREFLASPEGQAAEAEAAEKVAGA